MKLLVNTIIPKQKNTLPPCFFWWGPCSSDNKRKTEPTVPGIIFLMKIKQWSTMRKNNKITKDTKIDPSYVNAYCIAGTQSKSNI